MDELFIIKRVDGIADVNAEREWRKKQLKNSIMTKIK
jgi:hypothetical protein